MLCNKKWAFFALFLSISLGSQCGIAQDDSNLSPNTDSNANRATSNELPIEEIIVTREITTSSIRIQMKEATHNIYDVYNALNDDDKFDIHCSMVARLGTRLKKLVCLPEYATTATTDSARQWMTGQGAPSSTSVLAYYNAQLEEKMRDLIQKNPELVDAITKYNNLSLQLDDKIDANFGP